MPPGLHALLFSPENTDLQIQAQAMRMQQQQNKKKASELSWRWRLLLPHQDGVDQLAFLRGSCLQLLLSCTLSMGYGREEIQVLR